MTRAGRPVPHQAQADPPSGAGPVAGTGPDRPGLRHRPAQPQVVRRRHRDPTDEGKLYLDSVLDMGSRRIAGFALGEHHDADLAQAHCRWPSRSLAAKTPSARWSCTPTRAAKADSTGRRNTS